MVLRLLLLASICATLAHAHQAAWTKGMYCLNGATNTINLNSQDIVNPLWMLSQADWWFHHYDGCDQFPPPAGEFLELPAGGDFTVEIAENRAKTTLAYNGRYTSDWPDGATHPDNYNIPTCIVQPNMHTQNQSMAAGTAFAISYESDIKNVTPDNLVVFSVRYNTPWKRVTSYSVPAALPVCPPGGCICAWGWIPNGCGEPNMYHQPIKCNVTGATSTTPLAKPKPPVWCEDDPSKCVQGAKQMLYWNQAEGNNIAVSGYDLAGSHKSPAYNAKCGFKDGAQNDIFSAPSSVPASPAVSPSSTTLANSSSPVNHPSTNPCNVPTSTSTPKPSASFPKPSHAAPAKVTPRPPKTCKRKPKSRSAPESASPKKRSYIHHRRERRSW